MTRFDCPSCGARLAVTDVNRSQVTPPSESPITSVVLHDVRSYMGGLVPGHRYTSAELFDGYSFSEGYAKVSRNAFSRALGMCGATKWRSATERGFIVPKIEDDQKPPVPSPTVQRQEERDDYQAALLAHSTDTFIDPLGVIPRRP